MEKNRKNLRDMSGLVLFCTLLSAIRLISDSLALDFNIQNLPADVTEGLAAVSRIVLCVIGFILLLPQVYMGVKGIKLSKKPDASKGHIVWAIILTVMTAIAIYTPVSDIIAGVQVGANIMELVIMAVDILLFVTYAVCAKRVQKDAK